MLRGHVFSEQVFGVDIFALFINQFLGGNNGIIQSYKNAMEMTNTSNSITVKNGAAVIQGRYIEEHTETTLSYAKTDSLYCSLIIEIDLGKTNTRTSLEQVKYKILENGNSYPTLTQNDIINQTGNIYQFELARFQNGETGIVNFTDRRNFLSFDSVYSGIIQDNLTSTSTTSALSAKQGKVLNEKFSKNIITAYATQTSTVAGVNKWLELNELVKVGNKLNIVNNNIVIGAGVNKIKVSAKVLIDEQQLTTSFIYIGLNGNIINRGDGYGIYNAITLTDKLLNVSQGDVISVSVTSGTNATVYEDTYITVEVIE